MDFVFLQQTGNGGVSGEKEVEDWMEASVSKVGRTASGNR